MQFSVIKVGSSQGGGKKANGPKQVYVQKYIDTHAHTQNHMKEKQPVTYTSWQAGAPVPLKTQYKRMKEAES